MTVKKITYIDPKPSLRTRVAIPQLKTDWTLDEIAFFGSADVPPESQVYKDAFDAAQLLAEHGKTIVDGGGPGVMEASTNGAIAGGGKTIAVTFYPDDMPEFEGRATDNIVDVEIKTSNYVERMMGLLSEADAFVCFQGGTGTLSEWATAWLLAHLYYGHHKPIFLYGAFWRDFMENVNHHFLIDENEKHVYQIVESKEELLAAIQATENLFRVQLNQAST